MTARLLVRLLLRIAPALGWQRVSVTTVDERGEHVNMLRLWGDGPQVEVRDRETGRLLGPPIEESLGLGWERPDGRVLLDSGRWVGPYHIWRRLAW